MLELKLKNKHGQEKINVQIHILLLRLKNTNKTKTLAGNDILETNTDTGTYALGLYQRGYKLQQISKFLYANV